MTEERYSCTNEPYCWRPQPFALLHWSAAAFLSRSKCLAIREAILKPAALRSWRIVQEAPGSVVLAYPDNQRATRYEATFEVLYSAKSYRIRYLSSYGLDEKPNCEGTTPCLHRNVNKWVANLNMDIQRYISGLYR